jgi:hypothetical protein
MTERETEPPLLPEPYYRAARFRQEAASLQAYQNLESLFFREACELSAYRFLWDQRWHVAAVGSEPHPQLQGRVDAILSVGHSIPLPEEILQELARRRAQHTKQGPWIERHFR